MITELERTRYGRGRTRRWPALLAAVVFAAFLTWLVWAIGIQSSPKVTSALDGFQIVDAHTATVTLEVDLHDSGVHASCLLQATAEDHTVVGELNLDVRGPKGTQTLHRSIRTARGATSVELSGCTAPGQQEPR